MPLRQEKFRKILMKLNTLDLQCTAHVLYG